MLFILIGVIAAAFGVLDYLEIVDTPTSLVLTGVGAVTVLAGIGQLQKDKRAKGSVPTAAANGQVANGQAAAPAPGLANGAATPATNGGTLADGEKPSLWKRLNKPVGGTGKAGKHRAERGDDVHVSAPAEAPVPAPVGAPVAAAAPVANGSGAVPAPGTATTAGGEQDEGEKVSFWKKLNQPMGKKGEQTEGAADGGRRKRRRRAKEEDEGPLFPDHLTEGPDPFAAAAPPAGAIPPAPVPVAHAADVPQPGPADAPVVPQAPAVPEEPVAPVAPEPQIAASQATAPGVAEGLWEQPHDVPADQAPLQGTSGGQTAPIAPTAVAEPQTEAPRRGRRVCNYCWEPNEPTAAVCASCGAGL
jgi:hypothetical protein